LPNSRDAVRIAHLAEIEKSFNNYKTVSKFPLPDKKIEIKVNNELA
jgi:hypothetical protein